MNRCFTKAAFTVIYILMVYILIYIELHLYINLYIKKQHVFLLRNDNLYSIYTFQIKSSLFLLFLKSLNKQFIQYLIKEVKWASSRVLNNHESLDGNLLWRRNNLLAYNRFMLDFKLMWLLYSQFLKKCAFCEFRF